MLQRKQQACETKVWTNIDQFRLKAQQRREEGNKFVSAGNHANAITPYTAAINMLLTALGSIDPDYSELRDALSEMQDTVAKCFSNRSLCCLKLNRHDLAEVDAKRAVLFSGGEWGKSYFRLGQAQQNPIKCVEAYNLALTHAASEREKKSIQKELSMALEAKAETNKGLVANCQDMHKRFRLDHTEEGYLSKSELLRGLRIMRMDMDESEVVSLLGSGGMRVKKEIEEMDTAEERE